MRGGPPPPPTTPSTHHHLHPPPCGCGVLLSVSRACQVGGRCADGARGTDDYLLGTLWVFSSCAVASAYLSFTAPWHRLQLNLRGRRPWEKFRILASSLRHPDRNVRLAAMYATRSNLHQLCVASLHRVRHVVTGTPSRTPGPTRTASGTWAPSRGRRRTTPSACCPSAWTRACGSTPWAATATQPR